MPHHKLLPPEFVAAHPSLVLVAVGIDVVNLCTVRLRRWVLEFRGALVRGQEGVLLRNSWERLRDNHVAHNGLPNITANSATNTFLDRCAHATAHTTTHTAAHAAAHAAVNAAPHTAALPDRSRGPVQLRHWH